MQPIPLSNGDELPAGAIISVPNFALDYRAEETQWKDPQEFDGFRYYNLRHSDPGEHSHHLFSEASLDAMHFGLGRQACPGRFFASNEIKLIMAHFILDYDLKLDNSKAGRPKNQFYETQVLADADVRLKIRKRKPQDIEVSMKPKG